MSYDIACSAVTCTLLLTLSLTCSMSDFMKTLHSKSVGVLSWATDALIILLLLTAVAVMIALMCFAKWAESAAGHRERPGAAPWKQWLRIHLNLIGLVLFFLACASLDIIGLVADGSCIAVVSHACSRNTSVVVGRYLDIVHRVVRMIFALNAVVFSYKFRTGRFIRCFRTLIGLALIGTAALASWINMVLEESMWTLAVGNASAVVDGGRCFETNETDRNVIDCVTKNTSVYQLLERSSPYLYPLYIEFLLLFAECVGDWYFGSLATTTDTSLNTCEASQPTTARYIDISNPEERRRNGLNYSSYYCDTDFDEESTTLMTADHSARRTVFSWDPRQCCAFDCVNRLKKYPCSVLAAMTCVVANVVFILLGVVAYRDTDETTFQYYQNVFVGYHIFYWMLLTGCTLVGFLLARLLLPDGWQTMMKKTQPTGFEYFFIVCTVGPFLYCTFSIIANCGAANKLSVVDGLLAVLQIIAQTVFYFVAKSLATTISAERNFGRDSSTRRATFKAILLAMAFSNLALWAEDSFVETRNTKKSFQMQFYDNWPYIYDVFNPLVLMYRFNSIVLYTDVFIEMQ